MSFKREFPPDMAFKCFEILRSQHLEMYSLQAERLREEHRRQDFLTQGKGERQLEQDWGGGERWVVLGQPGKLKQTMPLFQFHVRVLCTSE